MSISFKLIAPQLLRRARLSLLRKLAGRDYVIASAVNRSKTSASGAVTTWYTSAQLEDTCP